MSLRGAFVSGGPLPRSQCAKGRGKPQPALLASNSRSKHGIFTDQSVSLGGGSTQEAMTITYYVQTTCSMYGVGKVKYL